MPIINNHNVLKSYKKERQLKNKYGDYFLSFLKKALISCEKKGYF